MFSSHKAYDHEILVRLSSWSVQVFGPYPRIQIPTGMLLPISQISGLKGFTYLFSFLSVKITQRKIFKIQTNAQIGLPGEINNGTAKALTKTPPLKLIDFINISQQPLNIIFIYMNPHNSNPLKRRLEISHDGKNVLLPKHADALYPSQQIVVLPQYSLDRASLLVSG